MKTDILNTIQNPDELRRMAQDLLDKQTPRIHALENDNAAIQAEKAALEQHIRGQEVIMLTATTAYKQRIRELEEALKLAQQWRFGRKSERLPADLLREETTLAPDTGSTCPDCGSEMHHIRDEVSSLRGGERMAKLLHRHG